jgi:predicted TIM-barrel fold metal-dependent hydrolase
MALLPDPAPRARQHNLISVDDHVIEPPDMFEGRLPAKLADRAPRIVESEDGRVRCGATRTASIDARIADMDIAGIWASLNFPSLIAGFSGTVFWKSDDHELGLAVLRTWNDWHLEQWAGAYPDRIIPLQLPWLADPQLAAEELRRNAARGFKAVSFPELPAQCCLPSLHTGSARWAPIPAPDTPFETITTLFPVNALVACADWRLFRF